VIDRSWIKLALFDAEMIEVRRLDALPKVEMTHSAEYEKNMTALKEECKRKERSLLGTPFKRRLFIAAVILIAVVLAITACAIIKPIKEFIEEKQREVQVWNEDGGLHFSGKPVGYEYVEKQRLSYVPEGYVLNETPIFDDDQWYFIEYLNGEKQIRFDVCVISSTTCSFYTDGSPPIEMDIDGKHIYLMENTRRNIVVWLDDKHIYTIEYPKDIDISEVEKMIRGIVKVDP